MAELRLRQRAARKSKVQPSQKDRAKKGPKKCVPGQRYDRFGYRRNVTRACEKAGVPKWVPLQLRHTAATLIRAAYGVEMARAVLGHSKVETSQIYAELDAAKAAKVAADLG